MKKLYVVANYESNPFGKPDFDGYIIVEDKEDSEYYAKVWNKKLAEVVKRTLEKELK